MLKGMKKFGIIFVFLLATMFFTKPVFAECDPTKFNVNKWTIRDNSCNPDECQLDKEQNRYKCAPKGVATQDPVCSSDGGEVFDSSGAKCSNYSKFCCVNGNHFGSPCVLKPNSNPLFSCNDSLENILYLSPKNSCSDSRFGFNNQTGKCEQGFATTWDLQATCTEGDSKGKTGIQSAIGCIPTESLPETLGFVLKFALGAAGGVIILMLIVTGYGILTSQGNPEKLAAAKENVVSIFSGLILIVFSLVLLQTIGANILGLPSF